MNISLRRIGTMKLTTMSLLLPALLAFSHSVARAQITSERTSAEATKTLCMEKQRRLTDLEKEAAGKQLEIKSAEDVLTKARRSLNRNAVEERMTNLSHQAQALTGAISLLQSDVKDEGLSNDERAEINAVIKKKQDERSQVNEELKSWQDVLNDNPETSDSVARESGQSLMVTKTLESKLAALREQQTNINTKISLERESIASLKCDRATVEGLSSKPSAGSTGDVSQRKDAALKVGQAPINSSEATQPIPRQPGNPTVATPVSSTPGEPAVQPTSNPGATQPIPREPGAATIATPRPTTPKPTVETPLSDRPTVATPKPASEPTKSGQAGGVRPGLAGTLVVALTVEQLHACYQRQASPSDCALTVAASLVAGGVITIVSPTGAVVLTGVKGAFDIKDGIAELNRDWEDWKQRQDQERMREARLERNRRDRYTFDELIGKLNARIQSLIADKQALYTLRDEAGRNVRATREENAKFLAEKERSTARLLDLVTQVRKGWDDIRSKQASIESVAANAAQKEKEVRKLLDQAIDLAKPANCNAANRDTARENYKQALNATRDIGRAEKDVKNTQKDMIALAQAVTDLHNEINREISAGPAVEKSIDDLDNRSYDNLQAASTISSRLTQGLASLPVEIRMLRGAYQLPDKNAPDEFRVRFDELDTMLKQADPESGLLEEIERRRTESIELNANTKREMANFVAFLDTAKKVDALVAALPKPDEAVNRVSDVVRGLIVEVADAGSKVANCISQPATQVTGNIATAAAGVVISDPIEELPEDKMSAGGRTTKPPVIEELPEDKIGAGGRTTKPPVIEKQPQDRPPNNANVNKPPPPAKAEDALCDVSGTWKGDYGVVRNYSQSGNQVTSTTDYYFGFGMRHEVLTGTLKRVGSEIRFELTIDYTESDGYKGKGQYVVSVSCGADRKATRFGNQTRVQ